MKLNGDLAEPSHASPGAAADVVAVLGPTASGKSGLGLDLARRLDGEIICCDSMQVYRGMDVGTGKPTAAERQGCPHHMLDVVAPNEPHHAAAWVAGAYRAVADITARGRLPLVVGGTGLYFRALVQGLFDAPLPDAQIRARHKEEAMVHGVAALHSRLARIDPEAAARILPNDLVRISRALEIFEQTGKTITNRQRAVLAPATLLRIFAVVLDPAMPALRVAIEQRIDSMMNAGFLDEVAALRAAGFGEARALQALGYRQLGNHLDGRLSLPEAVAETKRVTVAYARRQRTWFRKQEAALRLADDPDAAQLALAIASWRAC